MGKKAQDSAVEQVMEELNEEISPSMNTSPHLLPSGLFSESLETNQTGGEKTSEAQTDEGQAEPTSKSLSFVPSTASSTSPPLKEEITHENSKKTSITTSKALSETDQDIKLKSQAVFPSISINEPTPQEELSELENLLSFEPNRNRYQEDNNKPFPPLKENKIEKAKDGKKGKKSAKTEPQKQEDLEKSEPAFKPRKKGLMQEAIGKMADLYNQTTDPGISISLKQSENLRVAQERIVTLEEEIERLRTENEELISAGDIFRERLDKITVQNEHLKRSYEESREEFQEEKKTLMNTLSDQSREIEKLSLKNKELEKRLSSNIQQIRVRERDLENRLELMKLDSQTLVREKDQYILDLKRQVDRIKMDLETQKNKSIETEQKLKNQKSQTRRASRGLQMALHILKGNDFFLKEIDKEKEEESA